MSNARRDLRNALEALRLEVDSLIVNDIKAKIKAVEEENEVLYSINEYDWEGNISRKGVFIYIGENSEFWFENPDAFFSWVEQLGEMRESIEEDWYTRNS